MGGSVCLDVCNPLKNRRIELKILKGDRTALTAHAAVFFAFKAISTRKSLPSFVCEKVVIPSHRQKDSNLEILCDQLRERRRQRKIPGRIIDSSEVKGFTAFHTSATSTAMMLTLRITGPSLGKVNIEADTQSNNIGLCHFPKWCAKIDRVPIS